MGISIAAFIVKSYPYRISLVSPITSKQVTLNTEYFLHHLFFSCKSLEMQLFVTEINLTTVKSDTICNFFRNVQNTYTPQNKEQFEKRIDIHARIIHKPKNERENMEWMRKSRFMQRINAYQWAAVIRRNILRSSIKVSEWLQRLIKTSKYWFCYGIRCYGENRECCSIVSDSQRIVGWVISQQNNRGLVIASWVQSKTLHCINTAQ